MSPTLLVKARLGAGLLQPLQGVPASDPLSEDLAPARTIRLTPVKTVKTLLRVTAARFDPQPSFLPPSPQDVPPAAAPDLVSEG